MLIIANLLVPSVTRGTKRFTWISSCNPRDNPAAEAGGARTRQGPAGAPLRAHSAQSE